MNKIIITTEDGKNTAREFVVSERQYAKLDGIKSLGGFNRFDIDLYSYDNPKQPSDFNHALAFLAINVFNCDVATLKKSI